MIPKPVLAIKEFVKDGKTYRLEVKGGLCMLKGNSKPYFTITADLNVKTGESFKWDSGGTSHDEIKKAFPKGRFDDLIEMHLASIDGVPLYADLNGWYWLAGCFENGLGEEYHGGNGSDHKTHEECKRIFKELLRLDDEAFTKFLREFNSNGTKEQKKAFFKDFVEEQKPRWKLEAERCIEKHDLKIFGDVEENS